MYVLLRSGFWLFLYETIYLKKKFLGNIIPGSAFEGYEIPPPPLEISTFKKKLWVIWKTIQFSLFLYSPISQITNDLRGLYNLYTYEHPWPLTSHQIRKNSPENRKQPFQGVKKGRNYQESNRGGSPSPDGQKQYMSCVQKEELQRYINTFNGYDNQSHATSGLFLWCSDGVFQLEAHMSDGCHTEERELIITMFTTSFLTSNRNMQHFAKRHCEKFDENLKRC